MPVILLERIPLPRLRTYTAVSVALLACALIYAHNLATEISPEPDPQPVDPDYVPPTELYYVLGINSTDLEHTLLSVGDNSTGTDADIDSYELKMANVLLGETWCILSLVNMACCCLILLGRGIQKIVFGDLRVSEHQHLQDKFYNFAFYKFIFTFGVMNVQSMEEVVLWTTWFCILAGLHLLSQLCKDRFEYLSFSPATPMRTHIKVLILLLAIQAACVGLLVVCVLIGYMFTGLHIFCFLAAEVLLLMIKTSYVIVRYNLHLWDLLRQNQVWENRSVYGYYTELIFALVSIAIDFCNHLHMLVWSNIFLSMASLVICMQLRYLFHELQRRIRRHKNYLRVVHIMEEKFPMASREELEKLSENCSICWERMTKARKLPCGHYFHNACLRSWLEQDTSCPICRQSFSELQSTTAPQPETPEGAGDNQAAQDINMRQRQPMNNALTNHFFHFDGPRYVSWLPSFSVEVTHTQLMGNRQRAAQVQTSLLDNMARQVQEVFPNMPLSTINTDLQITRSVELTIENIVEGRLQAPPIFPRPRRSDSESETTSSGSDTDESPREGATSVAETENLQTFVPASASELYNSITTHLGAAVESIVSERSAEPFEFSREELPNVSGSRFSKSPSEREEMLHNRKQMLLDQAKRRFIEKLEGSTKSSASHSFDDSQGSSHMNDHERWRPVASESLPCPAAQNEENDIRLRRERAFLAAQRRLNLD